MKSKLHLLSMIAVLSCAVCSNAFAAKQCEAVFSASAFRKISEASAVEWLRQVGILNAAGTSPRWSVGANRTTNESFADVNYETQRQAALTRKIEGSFQIEVMDEGSILITLPEIGRRLYRVASKSEDSLKFVEVSADPAFNIPTTTLVLTVKGKHVVLKSTTSKEINELVAEFEMLN